MALMSAPLLTGCASVIAAIAEEPAPAVTAAPVCKAAVRPICVSPNDALTQRTATALLKNNEGILAVCPELKREFEKKKCPSGQVPAVDDPARPVKPPPAQMDAHADPKTS